MSNLTKGPAGRRILELLDDNSFVEIGESVRSRNTDFSLNPLDMPGDGVITGYGTIDGRIVYVYSQDASVMGGSVGEMHARKIVRLYKLAMRTSYPVIGLLDSTGMRLLESTDALSAFGKIYRVMARASGVIPQITAVYGNAGGGMAVLAGMSDFVFMEEKKAKLFVNSPNAIEGNYEEKKDTASASYKAAAGAADVVADEAGMAASIRELISFLPSCCEEVAFAGEAADDLNRAVPDIAGVAGDSAQVAARLADDGVYFEIKSDYAPSMFTAFIRLNGTTVGLIANRTQVLDEAGKVKTRFENTLSAPALRKAKSMVDFCDAFNIPVLTITDVSGFAANEHAEKQVAAEAAKLVFAFASSGVAKINLVTKQAYGSAAVIMNSKSIGADYAFAWKDSKIGAIDGRHAAEILFDGESDEKIKEQARHYDELQGSGASAAARGFVDTIIDPADTRKYIIAAFEMLYGKTGIVPTRKHGTV